jgi:serine/threonine protein phosphatase PrpC
VPFEAASAVGDPGRHPNEDAWAADWERGVFAVCDGVTSSQLPDGSYPTWAGGARAAWLAAAAIVAAAPAEGLARALAAADRLIGALNAARDDGPLDYYLHDAYNTTAVAAALAPDGRASVVCVGDAAALLQPLAGPPRLLTRFQTDAAEALRDELLRAGGLPEPERARLFRTELRNLAGAWRGHANAGFGVLDGTGRFAPLVESLDLSLAAGDRLYLCSDATGRALASLAAAGERLPATAAEALARARRWERETGASYGDDLTALIVER